MSPIRFEKKPGLVAYVTCGDPSLETTRNIVLSAISAGADVVELGVPFSDPVADGPVIQRASERALQHHTSLQDVLDLAREVRKQSDAGLIVFSYLNPILRYGLERFCLQAAAAASVQRLCLCGVAHRSYGNAKAAGVGRARFGPPDSQVHQTSGRCGLWHLERGAVRASGKVRGRRRGWQCDRAGRRAESGSGSTGCGRID